MRAGGAAPAGQLFVPVPARRLSGLSRPAMPPEREDWWRAAGPHSRLRIKLAVAKFGPLIQPAVRQDLRLQT